MARRLFPCGALLVILMTASANGDLQIKKVDQPNGLATVIRVPLPLINSSGSGVLIKTATNKNSPVPVAVSQEIHVIRLSPSIQLENRPENISSLKSRPLLVLPFPILKSNEYHRADNTTCTGSPGLFADLPGLDDWCKMNCALDNCPPSHCICFDGTNSNSTTTNTTTTAAPGPGPRPSPTPTQKPTSVPTQFPVLTPAPTINYLVG